MKKTLVALLLFCTISASAQQDPLFSQYMFNKLVVNPGYAGSTEMFSIDLLDRYQWVGIDGAPKTITLSAHSLVGNNVGLGGYVYRDQLGPTINQGAMATYSYRIMTRHGWFSFGLQGGIKYFDFDWNAISIQDPNDDSFRPQDVKKITPDVNLGLYYYTPKFFLGISSKQLLENEYGTVVNEGKTSFSRLARHFYVMSGMAIPINDKMVFRPSVMGKYVKNAPVQFDFNASILFSDIFWIGAAFRTEKAVIFLTEFKIAKGIRLGYSFDLYLNELQLHNKGSHEIRLGFDIMRKGNRMKTPRYF